MLSEWHLSPDDILDRWTDERLDLFWTKRNERMRRIRLAAQGEEEDLSSTAPPNYVSNGEFFNAPLAGSNGRTVANPNATRFKRVQVM
jgi:hypothetical protein